MSPQVVTWRPDWPSLGRAVACLGVFDGVHIGHQALVRHTVDLAHDRDVIAAVITFDRDPDQIVDPESAAPQLLDLTDKIAFLGELGPEIVIVVPFDEWIARLEPETFLSSVLCDAVEPLEVVVGYDFRFGHRARGDVDTLTHFGRREGFGVLAHELVQADGETVTSTRVRSRVAEGDVAGAAELLGRPHRVRGKVVHGRGAGVALGAPTANIATSAFAALPAHGVYAGTAVLGNERHVAGISVGRAPSFPDAHHDLEAHLIGFDGDLYGAEVVLEFAERLRDQRVFRSEADLAEAIAEDLKDALRALGPAVP